MESPNHRSASDSQSSPLDQAASDVVMQRLSDKFQCSVRRDYPAGALPVPSESLMVYDPTTNLGMELTGVFERQVVVTAQIWTLVDGSLLVESILVQCARSHGFPRMKTQNMGRVKIESGVIAIADRGDFLARPIELDGVRLREQVVRREFSEIPLGHRPEAKAILLPTGYGPGNFAVVASFLDNRLMEFAMFFLKGGSLEGRGRPGNDRITDPMDHGGDRLLRRIFGDREPSSPVGVLAQKVA
ncbi:MAG: hypothetical protein KDB01_23945 [Planctomycetaceae bacterium]|nr:hypothetical protein [Planctomycetaceae bacterium]